MVTPLTSPRCLSWQAKNTWSMRHSRAVPLLESSSKLHSQYQQPRHTQEGRAHRSTTQQAATNEQRATAAHARLAQRARPRSAEAQVGVVVQAQALCEPVKGDVQAGLHRLMSHPSQTWTPEGRGRAAQVCGGDEKSGGGCPTAVACLSPAAGACSHLKDRGAGQSMHALRTPPGRSERLVWPGLLTNRAKL